MTQKNDAPVLVVSLMLTVGLLGGGGWWLYQTLQSGPNLGGGRSTNTPGASTTASPNVSQSISDGNILLFPNGASQEKRVAIEAIANQDYSTAIQNLETSLNTDRNDPEALIYLNNARIESTPAYKIAVVVPSPGIVDVSQELLRGVAHAQQDINMAGGIEGIPLQVIVAADNNDIEQAQQVATALSQEPGILGVIGHFSSDVSLATADIYQAQRIVMVSPTSTSVKLSTAGDYIFRTVQSDRFAGDGLARHALTTMGVTNVAVFYNSQSNYSNSLKDTFSSAIVTSGGRIVAETDLSASEFNPSQAIAQAIQQGAEAIMLAADTSTRQPVLAVIAANNQQLKILGGDSLYNAEILTFGQANTLDMVISTPWHRAANPDADFPKAAQSLWGGPVSWRTAMAYDAAQALIYAIQSNAIQSNAIQSNAQAPDLVTAAMVQQTLVSTTFTAPGSAESIRFLPSGDRNSPPQLVTVVADSASEFGYSFAPIP